MEADYPRTNAVIGGADEGEHNHHGEKKSVMKKVKDKAKKIKDTITKHGGHGDDHEGEDDEDEETVNVSEVHCAPRFISGTNLPKQTGLDLGKPAVPSEASILTTEVYTVAGDGRGATKTTGVHDYVGTGGVVEGMHDHSLRNEVCGSKNPGVWEEMYDSNTRDEFRPEDRMIKIPDLQDEKHNRDEVYTGVEDEVTRTSGPEKFPDAMDLNETKVKIAPLEDLEEDPHRPKDFPEEISPSNYQTKVVDPTGQVCREADVSPLVKRLGDFHVGDDSGSEQRSFTGSHDQFAPESDAIPPSKNPTGSHDQFAPESGAIPPSKSPTGSRDQFAPESDAIPPSKNPESPKIMDPARPESMPRDTIAGKISSAIADKAVSAKNAVASKLGYGEAGKNNVVAVGDGGSVGGGGSDKGVSVKEYLSEKLSPGEEDRALSEAISDAIRKGYKAEDPRSENTGSGPGVVGRVKGWLGMSSGTQSVDPDNQSGGDVPVGGMH